MNEPEVGHGRQEKDEQTKKKKKREIYHRQQLSEGRTNFLIQRFKYTFDVLFQNQVQIACQLRTSCASWALAFADLMYLA